MKGRLLTSTLFFVFLQLQGCGESLPKVNDENCADTSPRTLEREFDFRTEKKIRAFQQECRSQKKGQWKELDKLPEINRENCNLNKQARFVFATDALRKKLRQDCDDFMKKNTKSWLP